MGERRFGLWALGFGAGIGLGLGLAVLCWS